MFDMNDLDEQKRELADEYDENRVKIDEFSEKIRTINANTFETRALSVGGLSFFSWLILFFLTPSIVKLGIIPLGLIQPLSYCIPLLIGIVGETIINKKFECKERLKVFSKSKNSRELLEESVRYEIEKEKLLNANKIIKNVYDQIEAKQSLISALAPDYDIKSKDEEEKSANVLGIKVDNLNDVLETNKKNIDMLTTKCVLKNRFWRVRDKFQRVTDIALSILFGGMFTMSFVSLPILAINTAETLIKTSLFNFTLSMLTGCLVSGIYYTRKSINHMNVFKRINKDLGNEALDNSSSDSERKRKMSESNEEQIDRDLEDLIKYSTEVKLQLMNEQQKLRKILESNDNAEVSEIEISNQLECEDNLTIPEMPEKGPKLTRKV